MKNTRTPEKGLLVIGIGNSGRRDDGLGWKFTELLAQSVPEKADYEYRYQLQVEDVLLVCQYKKVIFADASHAAISGGFELSSCLPAAHYFFSSHAQSPETILYLAQELYQKEPAAWTMAISGQNWGLGTQLSPAAKENLEKALHFMRETGLPQLQGPEKHHRDYAEYPQ